MPAEADTPPAAEARLHPREIGGWLAMMVGAAFVPGLVIALCVLVIIAIAHLAS